jgi:hypothetical protein
MTKHCKSCGKELLRIDGRIAGIYCDTICQKAYEKKIREEKLVQYYEKYNAAPTFEGKNGVTVSIKHVKAYLLKKRGDKCEICGIENWQNKPLIKILDHIDGDSLNWNFSNLRLVCSNCDSQLPTYKSKNKKSKREYRKKFKYK